MALGIPIVLFRSYLGILYLSTSRPCRDFTVRMNNVPAGQSITYSLPFIDDGIA